MTEAAREVPFTTASMRRAARLRKPEDVRAAERAAKMASAEDGDPSLAAPGRALMYALASLVTVAHREQPLPCGLPLLS